MTLGPGSVRPREAHAPIGQRIPWGMRQIVAPMAAQRIVPVLIGHDQLDVAAVVDRWHQAPTVDGRESRLRPRGNDT
jgi:hypothetical protein